MICKKGGRKERRSRSGRRRLSAPSDQSNKTLLPRHKYEQCAWVKACGAPGFGHTSHNPREPVSRQWFASQLSSRHSTLFWPTYAHFPPSSPPSLSCVSWLPLAGYPQSTRFSLAYHSILGVRQVYPPVVFHRTYDICKPCQHFSYSWQQIIYWRWVEVLLFLLALELDQTWKQQYHSPSLIHDGAPAIRARYFAR